MCGPITRSEALRSVHASADRRGGRPILGPRDVFASATHTLRKSFFLQQSNGSLGSTRQGVPRWASRLQIYSIAYVSAAAPRLVPGIVPPMLYQWHESPASAAS